MPIISSLLFLYVFIKLFKMYCYSVFFFFFFFLLLCMPGSILLMMDILNFMLLSSGSCCSPLMSIGFCSRLQLSFLQINLILFNTYF